MFSCLGQPTDPDASANQKSFHFTPLLFLWEHIAQILKDDFTFDFLNCELRPT